MTTFRIASNDRRFDRERNEWTSTDPVYLSVACWRQLADNVAKTVRKGDTVIVHGRLTMREYDDTHGGPRRQSYEIEAHSVGPDLARYRADLTRPARDIEPQPLADADLPTQPASGWDEPESVSAA